MTDKRLANTSPGNISILEEVIAKGDLNALSPQQRGDYYVKVCESLELNPMTQPFSYLLLGGKGRDNEGAKLILYANRTCTDQLRANRGINLEILSREVVDGVYIVTVQATDRQGRIDTSIGAVPLMKEGGKWVRDGDRNKFQSDGTFIQLAPEERSNAMMKAETKAKRRVTLSLCGLGMLDESEVGSFPNSASKGQIVTVNPTDDMRAAANPSLGAGDKRPPIEVDADGVIKNQENLGNVDIDGFYEDITRGEFRDVITMAIKDNDRDELKALIRLANRKGTREGFEFLWPDLVALTFTKPETQNYIIAQAKEAGVDEMDLIPGAYPEFNPVWDAEHTPVRPANGEIPTEA